MPNYYCYILYSKEGNQSTRELTYIGYTKNLLRRLKQHCGLLPGGAKATRSRDNWRMIRAVTGFRTPRDAQDFERSWKLEPLKVKPIKGKRKFRRVTGWPARCARLGFLLKQLRWKDVHLLPTNQLPNCL